MTKNTSKETRKIIALGIVFIVLSFCSVYTAVKIGSDYSIQEMSRITETESDYYQSIRGYLNSIYQCLEDLRADMADDSTNLQETLEGTMDQMTAMNAVFLDYGKRMGILIQED